MERKKQKGARQMGWEKDEIEGVPDDDNDDDNDNDINGQVVRRQTADGEEHMVHMNGRGDAWLVEKQVPGKAFDHSF